MDFCEYQNGADRTSSMRGAAYDGTPGTLGERRLFVSLIGLTGELGEVAEHVKKAVAHGHKFDQDKVEAEIGDVCWYMAELCSALGLDWSKVAQRNIDKLKKRYPDGFSAEASLNRVC